MKGENNIEHGEIGALANNNKDCREAISSVMRENVCVKCEICVWLCREMTISTIM